MSFQRIDEGGLHAEQRNDADGFKLPFGQHEFVAGNGFVLVRLRSRFRIAVMFAA